MQSNFAYTLLLFLCVCLRLWSNSKSTRTCGVILSQQEHEQCIKCSSNKSMKTAPAEYVG